MFASSHELMKQALGVTSKNYMSEKDWYRLKCWSMKNKIKFMERLHRSRTEFHKAQYLRIQALELTNDIFRPKYNAALELIDMIIGEFPCKSQLAEAYEHQSECYSALGKDKLALNAVEKALDAQRNFPNSKGSGYQLFSELILKMKIRSRYTEALDILEEFMMDEPFPIMRYRTSRAKALLYDRLGNTPLAISFSINAVDAAKMDQSPFKYHKKLGLVHTPNSKMHNKLLQLAAIKNVEQTPSIDDQLFRPKK